MTSKVGNKVNLDKTLQFTKSSFAYHDPYQLNGGIIYQIMNKIKNFIAIRNIENEFVDFKELHIQSQFKDINSSAYKAYSRSDKVNLKRSLSESMYNLATSQRAEKKPNPFFKEIHSLKPMQARIYSENDKLLSEEQWAQITLHMKGSN